MLLYIYDLKGGKNYPRLKRRFYYHLSRSPLGLRPWRTKSVLLVEESFERQADAFFAKWKPNIECYKVKTSKVVEI